MLVAADKMKRVWWATLDIVLFTLLTTVFLFLLVLPLSFLFPSMDGVEEDIGFLVLNEVAMLVSALLAALVIWGFKKQTFSRLGLSLKGWGRSLLSGTLLVVLLYAVGFGISLLLGAVEVAGFLFSPASLLLTLMFYFLVAVTEELIACGFIMGCMLDRGINKYAALFVSATLFSLMHIFNPNFAFVPFLNILLAGLFLGASCLYTRNLCFPIALHWFWNWIQGPVLGYSVSGNEFGYPSLLALHLPEENLLNGGSFGFEGSLLCSCLLVLGTMLIVVVND